MPTTWLVSTGSGSNNNGGTSVSVLATRTDGVTDATTTLTSAGAAFTNALVGHGIKIGSSYRTVVSVTDGTHLVYSGASLGAASGVTYTIGGMWATIAQAMSSANPVVGGDTIYIAPGTYRETVTPTLVPSSQVSVIGDVDGYYTGSTGGSVKWTAYTTNDTTAPSASNLLSLAGTPSKNWLFANLVLIGGSASRIVDAGNVSCTGVTFQDCVFIGYTTGTHITITTPFGASAGWLIDRCRFMAAGNGSFPIQINCTRGTGADYDMGCTIRACLFMGWGAGAARVNGTGAGVNLGGGLKVLGCSIFGVAQGVSIGDANVSTSIPAKVYGCFIAEGSTGLFATSAGQITEDYNIITAATARSNVTAGTHSFSDNTHAISMELGQEYFIDRRTRPFGTPTSGSSFLGFVDTTVDASYPTLDLLGRPIRSGGASTLGPCGCYGRHDTGAQDNSQSPPAGYFDLLQTGPCDDEFLIPVQKNRPTTITVQFKTASYNGTNYPQLLLLQDGEAGVAAQTITAGSAAVAFTTLATAQFTPTANGWVRIRLLNRTGDGAGIVYWRQPFFPAIDTATWNYVHRGELPRALQHTFRPHLLG